jgi:hypothetical protein
MAAADPLPPALRASDSDREKVIQVLQEESADGRLSPDTFVRRLDLAMGARGVAELTELVTDLPPRNFLARSGRFLVRAVATWSAFVTRLEAAWQVPRLPRLVLPPEERAVFTIGRSPDCDLTFTDPTVSWRHAELRRAGDGWVLVDVGSTNGTRVNRWQAGSGLTVRPGDCVTFGQQAFRLHSHP